MRPEGAPDRLAIEDGACEGTDAPHLILFLDSTPLSVRAALSQVRISLAEYAIGSNQLGAIELVLAEVMNNICEHAYGGGADGRLELRVWVRCDVLAFETRDDGTAMPEGTTSRGCPAAGSSLADIPEGGFGWHLIRHLTEDLHYARVGDRNHLSFRIGR